MVPLSQASAVHEGRGSCCIGCATPYVQRLEINWSLALNVLTAKALVLGFAEIVPPCPQSHLAVPSKQPVQMSDACSSVLALLLHSCIAYLYG